MIDLDNPQRKRKHPLAECENCTLYHGTYVPTKFPTKSHNGLVFIGESPGQREKAKGEPFVGQSGKLLNEVLKEVGIDRDASLLTNAALCNYKDEEKSVLPEAIKCCRPRLLAEIDEAGSQKAITLGNTAVSSLIDTKVGITKLRGGAAKSSNYKEGLSVVPTFHPAACLRAQQNVPLFLGDIKKAVDTNDARWIEPNVHTITDARTAYHLLRDSRTTYPLVVDTESAWDKDTSFVRNTNILCVGLGSTHPDHNNDVIVIGKPAITSHLVQRELIRLISRVGMVAQNAKYDYHVLNALNTEQLKIPIVYDTMLASYSMHESPGIHGLKYMSNEYLGTPHYEEEIKEYLVAPKDPPDVRAAALDYLRSLLGTGEVYLRTEVIESAPDEVEEAALKRAAKELRVVEFKDETASYRPHQIRWTIDPNKTILVATPEADGSFASVPPELLHKYNAFDVQATRQLYFYFRDIQRDQGLERINAHLVRMSNTLARVESSGLTVDVDFNTELGKQFQDDINRLSEYFDFNPGSVPKLKAYFEETFGITLASTSEDTLVELKSHAEPHVVESIDALLEFRRVKKLKSTYVDSVAKKAATNEGKIFPSFVINQATTGRLASKNPNVQNMPRLYDIKRQFIPSSPDHVFVHADYSQLELRVITWLSRDEGMRALFNDPERDVFDELTIGVHGMGRDEFYKLKNGDPKTAKEMRVAIKSFAYGILFSRSAAGIANDPDMDISYAEAERQMNLFKRQIPGIMRYQDEIKAKIHRGEDLINPFGRHRRFHLFTNQNTHELERQAVSFMPQSTASDICITACGKIVDMGYRVCNIIHDAILLECHKDEVEQVSDVLRSTMVQTAEEVCDGGWIKFDVDATYGKNWQDAA